MSRRTELWMWAEACEFIRRAERLQNRFFEPGRPAGRARVCWEPPMDIVEAEDALHICVALPGVEPSRVEVALHEGGVTVSGERPMALPSQRITIHRLEIPHGRFERHAVLPPGRYRLRERRHADGCLMVVLDRLA